MEFNKETLKAVWKKVLGTVSSSLLAVSLFLGSCSNAISQEKVFLPAPNKDQTGYYSVRLDGNEAFETYSAANVEVFLPGERLLPWGGTISQYVVHVTLYDNNGAFVVMTGFTDGSTSFPVEVYDTLSADVRNLGTGNLSFDPKRIGEAGVIAFEFAFEPTADATIFGQSALKGEFVRNSDVRIFGCQPQVQFSPTPPFWVPTAWCN